MIKIPRPDIRLKVLDNTIVKISHSEEWRKLMWVYEFGGWKLGKLEGQGSPSKNLGRFDGGNIKDITAGRSYKFWQNGINTVGIHNENNRFHPEYENEISVEEFFKLQGITKNTLYNIDFYLEQLEGGKELERLGII